MLKHGEKKENALTSKERVRFTMEHSEADRVPFHMNASTTVVKRLKETLLLQTDKELLDRLHIDTFDMRGIDICHGVMPRYIGGPHPTLHPAWSGDIVALWGIVQEEVVTPYGTVKNQVEYPLREASGIDELSRYQWPDPDWFDYSDLSERLDPWKDRSIILTGASVWQHPSYVRGLDVLLMDLLLQPDVAEYLFDVFTDFYLEFFKRILKEIKHDVDSIALADDLGMQSGLMISPEMFHNHVAPRIKKFAELAHAHNCKLILHTDGNIRSIIPDLISIGVDVLDPLQPEAEGMNPVEIKQEFGSELVLRGGISTQHTLAYGTEEDVRNEVKRVLEIMAPSGGYILSPGHPVLQADVPVENIITMYDSAYEFGWY